MIIHPIEIKLEEDNVCVSAAIECHNKNPDLPGKLWYRFPAVYKDGISRYTDGFVVSLLLLAMSLGEDIEVKEGLSSYLAYNLNKYQRIFNFWCPKVFKLIEIKGERLKTNEKSRNGNGVMSSFSGGVDSIYTLWSHLPHNEPDIDYQITHALFIHGFDIPLNDKRTYQIALDSYIQLMNKLKIKMIPLTTNLKQFHRSINWELTHSSAVVGTALIFDGLISRFYFSENDTYDNPPYYGIHFSTIPLLSTETFESIDHDGSVTKIEKLEAISKWPETYDRLRVCWQNPNGLKNCSKCFKCTFTMTALDIIGTLNKYTTFTLPIDRKAIRRLRHICYEDLYYAKTWISFALSARRMDIAFDWAYVFLFSQIKLCRDVIVKIIIFPFKKMLLKDS